MKTLVAAALVVFSTTALQAGEDNPFKKAKVGDWAEYKVTLDLGFAKESGKVKITVTARNEKQVTLKAVATKKDLLQAFFIDPERTIDLAKPLDLSKPISLFSSVKHLNPPKMKKVKTGSTTIESGGKEYKANSTQYKLTYTMPAGTGELTIWMSRDVPLYGLVKRSMTFKDKDISSTNTVELTGSGSK